jgi:hypothetical protein
MVRPNNGVSAWMLLCPLGMLVFGWVRVNGSFNFERTRTEYELRKPFSVRG